MVNKRPGISRKVKMTIGSQISTGDQPPRRMGASRREERLAQARLSRVAEINGK